MLKFPRQQEKRDELFTAFGHQFDFASNLYQFWMLSPKEDYYNRSPLPMRVKRLAMLLNTQACRQYRTIVTLCEDGEGLNSTIICRSLFETLLATGFLLRKTVRIAAVPVRDRNRKIIPGQFKAVLSKKGGPKVELSRELRAVLYVAHAAFADGKLAARLAIKPGLRRLSQVISKRTDKQFVALVKKTIGPKWEYVLHNYPHTYSGLSVAQLADALGPGTRRWYNTIYSIQSRVVHGTECLMCLDESDDYSGPASYSTDGEILNALHLGTTLFLNCLDVLVGSIGFGPRTRSVLSAFTGECNNVFRRS